MKKHETNESICTQKNIGKYQKIKDELMDRLAEKENEFKRLREENIRKTERSLIEKVNLNLFYVHRRRYCN